MKKIVYSTALKLIAVLLLVVSVVLGVLITARAVIWFDDEELEVYSFERGFSESWYVSYLLREPENVLFNAYQSIFRLYDEYGDPIAQDEAALAAHFEELEANIRQRFDDFPLDDKVLYYVKWNDLVLASSGVSSAEELMTGELYTYAQRGTDGKIGRAGSTDRHTYGYLLEELGRIDGKSTIVICCSLRPETLSQYRALWERQERMALDTGMQLLACAAAALLLMIYLICVCGKNGQGEYKGLWIDKVWLEVHLAFMAGAGLGAIALCLLVIETYMSGDFPHDLLGWFLGAVSALGSLVIVTAALSVIRNIKRGQFLESSAIFRLARWLLRLLWRILRWGWRLTKAFWRTILGMLSRKTGVILTSMLLVYTAVIGLLGIGTVASPIWLLVGVAVFGFACFVVAYRARDLDEIKKGVGKVRRGEVSYQIPALKCEDMRALAEDVNGIAMGLDEAVSARVKAERMKAELITNVSHDLKTPITSLISYAELLSQTEGLSDEARDYVCVIAKKADRLKRLTQDLFDISKVQSGNEEVTLERLDAALLIEQALGEQDGEIQSSGLPFCVDVAKELYISADGRKLSRVLSNLIGNILKYAMKGTRVFISARERGGWVEMEFKNISAYPLNLTGEEITQRFVRGDESRTAEGNGLGLAIAKSFTELCGGALDVVVDGDLFKVILKFRKIS